MMQPWHIQWLIPGRVIHIQLPDTFTLDDLHHLNVAWRQYLDQGTPLVHTLIDATRVKQSPLNVMKLREVMVSLDHPHFGWLIPITANKTLKFIGAIVPQMVGKTRNRMVATLEEAITFLRDQDQTIDWEQMNEGAMS
jgi:hypothetical protein